MSENTANRNALDPLSRGLFSVSFTFFVNELNFDV
ncbi:hypothetical protein RB2150_03219 [Rhodobacterales bacterium HTCC2150]|nr:hypothetical protein RB2150_03219 [Rhodobacterales bacterium HTCC2150] [Rhodobacteraceae bacterium HTCC2150]